MSIEVPDEIRESIMKKNIVLNNSNNLKTELILNNNDDQEFITNDIQQEDKKISKKIKNSTVNLLDISSELQFDDSLQDDNELLDINNLQSNDKKVRVRSVISDDVLAVLKLHFKNNPKPSRDEIIKLSKKLKHPQRVLQVWFQNMRAKTRRNFSSSNNNLC